MNTSLDPFATRAARLLAAQQTPELAQLGKLAGGDLAALGALFKAYGAAIGRFVRSAGVVAHEVDDVVQQVFLDVPRAARRYDYDRQTSVRHWLLGIARIAVLRHARLTARRSARHAQLAADPSLGPRHTDISCIIESRDGAARAIGALHGISAKKREVFELVVLDDGSGEDVARTLGVPVATVWTRLHYARQELRRLLRSSER